MIRPWETKPDAPQSPASLGTGTFTSQDYLRQMMELEDLRHKHRMEAMEDQDRRREERRARGSGIAIREEFKAKKRNAGDAIVTFVRLCGGPDNAKKVVKGAALAGLATGTVYVASKHGADLLDGLSDFFDSVLDLFSG